MSLFKITIEKTSNPSIVKFIANQGLTEGSFEYQNIEEATNSTLVAQLFHLPFVKNVFVSANFLAIERYPLVEWQEVQDELQQVIESFLNKNGSLFTVEKANKIMPVQIYAESTPNPEVQKFVTNKLLSATNIEVKSIDDVTGVPLAKALFDFNYINELFISENYISITKVATVDWFELTNEIRAFLKKYLEEGGAITDENFNPTKLENTEYQPVDIKDLDEISKEIVSILDEYIKPAVTSDGGNIMFQSYHSESKTVNVILQGACSGCPSSTITLKNGIEATLKQLMPNKIEEVIAING